MNNIVYVIKYGVGKIQVCMTRHGMWHLKRNVQDKDYEILECHEVGDELLSVYLKHLANFIKQDFILVGHSKAEQVLAKKLYLGGKRKHKGNPHNLKRKESADSWLKNL